MRDFFMSSLVAAASLLSKDVLVEAGLPRHCFMATELHGPTRPMSETSLLSDLPMLIAMGEPGIRFDSITA